MKILNFNVLPTDLSDLVDIPSSISHYIKRNRPSFTFADNYSEAEHIFQTWGIDGNIKFNTDVEKQFIDIKDDTYKITITECYVDSGSDDYLHIINVEAL